MGILGVLGKQSMFNAEARAGQPKKEIVKIVDHQASSSAWNFCNLTVGMAGVLAVLTVWDLICSIIRVRFALVRFSKRSSCSIVFPPSGNSPSSLTWHPSMSCVHSLLVFHLVQTSSAETDWYV